MITLIIFLLLFIKLGKGWRNETLLNLLYILLFINTLTGFYGQQEGSLFAGMFVTTPLIFFQKSLLSIGTLLIALLNYDWLKKHAHLPEFFMLLLCAQLGMFLLISSGNFLIFFLSLELSTIPIAALANFDLDKRRSSEAAMKLILSSAFSSGMLLFGISLLYGSTGTILFSEMPSLLKGDPLTIVGFILFFTGLAFKLSVVPFHLWTADVYEGSPVAVTSFLSVISKGSVAFILITILYKVFQPLGGEITYPLLLLLSLFTLIIGNLFALRQNNLKRFLAFSSIAQVGFILVALSSGVKGGAISVTYFILIYVFSNLAAFGVVSIISEASGKETVDEYKGLYKNNKLLSWVMAIALFSLAGIPPTAGFFGKLFLVMAGAARQNSLFIVVVALNLVYLYIIICG
jgi:NADH-quinone oxidoreductase subunit N